MNNEIIILSGFSACGKDTLAKELEKLGSHFIISHTTRPIRNGETDGNPYFFITKETFLRMALNKEFLEHRKYNTLVNNIPDVWHYGVHKSQVVDDNINVVVLDMLGLREFKNHFGDRCVSFFIDADVEERRRRCLARGDYDETEFNRRYEDDLNNFPQDLIKKEINVIIKSTNPLQNLKEIVGCVSMRRELRREK